ncbi:MAG: hypothetical protein HKN48_12815, partial [Flavobacteriaceae bacterium]|nr:hypothetical protein [Flavobacteriaceae bacterium]
MEAGTYLLKSVAILSLFYMVYFIFLRKDTLFTAKRHFFLFGIAAALFLPFVEITRTIVREAQVLQSNPVMDLSGNATDISVASEPEVVFNVWEIALIIYGIGVLFMLSKLTIQLISLLKLLRTYPSEKHQKYSFVKVGEAITPFSFFRYIVFNPASHSEEELKMILKHEQVHVSQWHSIDIIVGHMTRAVQWVNPFSWWYKKSLEENLEFIADNETVSQVPSKKEYQLALVKTSSPLLAPALSTQFYQSFIKKRIIMLNKSTSKRRNLWKLGFVVPALALFLWSFNVTEVVEYKQIEIVEPDSAVTSVIPSETAETEPIENKQPTTSLTKEVIEPAQIQAPPSALSKHTSLPSKTVAVKSNTKVKKTVDFRYTITKNTSNAQLDEIKAELKKEYNIDLKYKAERNSNNEIVAINISYDDNKGGSGNYSINNDDEPIDDFVFFLNEDGERGFWSEAQEARRAERMENREMERAKRMADRAKRMQERELEMVERKEELEKRQVKIKEEMKERMREMKDRQEEMIEREREMVRASNEMARRNNRD